VNQRLAAVAERRDVTIPRVQPGAVPRAPTLRRQGDTRHGDHEPHAPDLREGARIRRRHRADQVVDLGGRARPVDPSVLGLAGAEVAAPGRVVRQALGVSRPDRRQRPPEDDFRGDRDLVEHLSGRVVREDGHRHLVDDGAGIRPGDHPVQRRAGLGLAVQHGPVRRRAAAVLRQQRAMHVERPSFASASIAWAASPGSRRRRSHRARRRPPRASSSGFAEVVCEHGGQAQVGRGVGDPLEPQGLAGAVAMRHDEAHLDAARPQDAQAAIADVGVREHDGPHATSSCAGSALSRTALIR
jgi:hypothetical protein